MSHGRPPEDHPEEIAMRWAAKYGEDLAWAAMREASSRMDGQDPLYHFDDNSSFGDWEEPMKTKMAHACLEAFMSELKRNIDGWHAHELGKLNQKPGDDQ
jgi:hypothetical protein